MANPAASMTASSSSAMILSDQRPNLNVGQNNAERQMQNASGNVDQNDRSGRPTKSAFTGSRLRMAENVAVTLWLNDS
jgi:hypothetical protein